MELDWHTTEWLEKELRLNLTANKEYCENIITELKKRSGVGVKYSMDKDTQIRIIMGEFKFVEVQKIFDLMNYQWFYSPTGVPNVEEIKKLGLKLLNEAWDSKEEDDNHILTISTGRLTSTRAIYSGVKILSLEFIPISYELDYDWVTNPDEDDYVEGQYDYENLD